MDQKILDAVSREFSAIDFTDELAEIAELQSELRLVEEKRVAVDERRSAIAREIHEYRGPSGDDVARAILDGLSPTEAAKAGPNMQALEGEKEALLAGGRALRDRAEDLRAQITNVETAARAKIVPGSQKLETMLISEALALLEQLVPVYANLTALAATTRFAGNKIVKLREVLNAANGFEGFAGYRRDIEVSPALNDTLRHLDGQAPALRTSFITVANL